MSATLSSRQHNRIYRRVRLILRELQRDGSGEGAGGLIALVSYPALVVVHHTVSDATWWSSMIVAFWLWLVIVCVWGYVSSNGGRRAKAGAGATFDRYYPAGASREAALEILRSMARNPNSPHGDSAAELLDELGEAPLPAEEQLERVLGALPAGPEVVSNPGAQAAGSLPAAHPPPDPAARSGHIPLEPSPNAAVGGRRAGCRSAPIPLEPDDGDDDPGRFVEKS